MTTNSRDGAQLRVAVVQFAPVVRALIALAAFPYPE